MGAVISSDVESHRQNPLFQHVHANWENAIVGIWSKAPWKTLDYSILQKCTYSVQIAMWKKQYKGIHLGFSSKKICFWHVINCHLFWTLKALHGIIQLSSPDDDVSQTLFKMIFPSFLFSSYRRNLDNEVEELRVAYQVFLFCRKELLHGLQDNIGTEKNT